MSRRALVNFLLTDLAGPCLRTWAPRTCSGWDQRSPVDHQCFVPRAFPHICHCTKCRHVRQIG